MPRKTKKQLHAELLLKEYGEETANANINMRIPPAELAALEEMAGYVGLPKSRLVRAMIRYHSKRLLGS